jgi:mevalonate kinase
VLLFGEYTVTIGSGAIAMPYLQRSGYWDFDRGTIGSSTGLELLLKYLEDDKELSTMYNLLAFKTDIANGLVFRSDIPTGYGLGSSGALVAAFYDKYCKSPTNDILTLKSILAKTESAFHGSSSGLDPLVSYLNDNVIIRENGTIETTQLDVSDVGFFLIDSGISRQTEFYVEIFKRKLKSSDEFNIAVQTLAALNRKAITYLQSGDKKSLFEVTSAISKMQYEHFSEMIPNNIKDSWEQGLESGKYSLKLCGAGGGGMIMGMLANASININTVTNLHVFHI